MEIKAREELDYWLYFVNIYVSNDAILIQTLDNLGHLEEGNSEFSPTGDNEVAQNRGLT